MNLIDRYIGRAIITATGVVSLVVVAIVTLMLFIDQADDLGRGHYDLWHILVYMACYLPARLYLVLPVLALLGALMALGSLAAGSELVVIRSAGVSMWRLVGSVSVAGFLMALASVALGEYLAPAGVHFADNLRDKAVHGRVANSIDQGLWLRQGHTIVRIDSTLPGGRIDGLDVYQLTENGRLARTITAPRARLRQHRLEIDHPSFTRLATDHTETGSPDRLTLDLEIDPDVLALAVVKPTELSSSGLWHYIDYLQHNDINATSYRLALWRNIVNPFTVWVLTIFALPFAFGSLRNAGAGQRLFLGGLVGLVFFLLNEILASAGPVYGVAPAVAAAAPTVLLALVTLAWIRRIN